MSRTNIDYLFQVTSADRAFFLARADGQRPPFGDHLSLASASTGAEPFPPLRRDGGGNATSSLGSKSSGPDATSGRPPGSADRDTESSSSTVDDLPDGTDFSNTSSAQAEVSTDDSSDAADRAAATTAGDMDEDHETDEGRDPLAEAAAGQAAAGSHSKAAAAANAVTRNVSSNDSAVTSVETANNQANTEQRGETTSNVAGAEDAAADANSVEIADASLAAEQISAANDPVASNGLTLKKTRAARGSKDSAEAKEGEGRKLGAAATGEAKGDEESDLAIASMEGFGQAEQASIDRSTVDGEATSTDVSRSTSNERGKERTPADMTAVANKIVAAAIQGAAQVHSGAATAEGGEEAKQIAKPQAAKSDPLAAASDRFHSQSVGGKLGARTSSAEGGPQVDPARFVGRVAKAFQTANERGGTLQLRLAPPELGALRLELTVKEGVMSASLETENQAARRVLLEHLPALRERLAEQNIRIERFDVDVRREGGGQEPAPQNQERQNPSESRRQSASSARSEEASRDARPTIQPITNNSGINLVA
jgi:flagellar hook-length control protein FliK